MSREFFNYLTHENGAAILECSSFKKNGPCDNVLTSDRRSLWLSESGLPQFMTFNLSELKQRPQSFKSFGFDCWHDLQSNPAELEIQVSPNGENFISWMTFNAKQKAGIQLFDIDPIPHCYNFVQVLVNSTFGENRTYSNQFFLLKENLSEIGYPGGAKTGGNPNLAKNHNPKNHFGQKSKEDRRLKSKSDIHGGLNPKGRGEDFTNLFDSSGNVKADDSEQKNKPQAGNLF
jgi:hypothetical protein